MKRLRSVIICLLAFALPSQGYAAQTMIFCDPQHHQTSLPSKHDHAMHDHEAHSHALVDAAEATTTDSTPVLHVEGKCSVCASCCNLVAIIASMAPFASVRIAAPGIAHYFESITGITPGGLERPPRPFLA